jgi:hypothetical protein
VELVDRKAMVDVARKVLPAAFKRGGGAPKKSEAEVKARAVELRKQKIDAALTLAGMTALGEAIEKKGLGLEEMHLLLEISLPHAGSDGRKLMAKWLGVEQTKNNEWEKPILDHIRERGHTKPGLEALCVITLLSQSLRWSQTQAAGFRSFAKHYDVDMKSLAKKVTEEIDGKKVKSEKGEEKLKSVSRSLAVRRNDEAVDHGERSELGMTEDDGDPTNESFDCDNCQRCCEVPAVHVPAVNKLHPGEFLCTNCGGAWVAWDEEDQPPHVAKRLKELAKRTKK